MKLRENHMIESSDSHSTPRLRARALRGRLVLRLAFIIAVTSLSVLTSAAQTIDMTKIVFRRADPSVAPDSADAKPRTIYIAGEKYTRVESEPDPVKHTHMLIVTQRA